MSTTTLYLIRMNLRDGAFVLDVENRTPKSVTIDAKVEGGNFVVTFSDLPPAVLAAFDTELGASLFPLKMKDVILGRI